ncbi:MAG: VCBS repeat-containing protein [Planctomycetota bacterium]
MADVDGDGVADLISGCYSRHDSDMAGEFSLYRGRKGADFGPREILMTADEEEILELPIPKGSDRICRVATAACVVDLDGDGRDDLLVGGLGSFALYRGAKGGGFLAAKEPMTDAKGDRLYTPAFAGPCCVDWDGDGDLDIVSGSKSGGVYLSENRGDRGRPAFGEFVTLIAPPVEWDGKQPPRFGDWHLNGPGDSTRVWVEDIDGDGRLDLLVGDRIDVYRPGEGLDEPTARRRWLEIGRKITPQMEADEILPLRAQQRRAIPGEGRGHIWFFRGR